MLDAMRESKKRGSKSTREYYKMLGLVQKNIYLKAETIYKLEVLAARQTMEKKQHISFTTVVQEILDAAARELPDK